MRTAQRCILPSDDTCPDQVQDPHGCTALPESNSFPNKESYKLEGDDCKYCIKTLRQFYCKKSGLQLAASVSFWLYLFFIFAHSSGMSATGSYILQSRTSGDGLQGMWQVCYIGSEGHNYDKHTCLFVVRGKLCRYCSFIIE